METATPIHRKSVKVVGKIGTLKAKKIYEYLYLL